jgi:lipopolysaccharide export system ATP-binding protein
MDVLEVDSLEKTYGRRKVVDGVSMYVGESEIVGLLGPNGAGKSTTFRMTCGMVRPDRGSVRLGGQDVTDWPMFQRARDGHMGYLAQESSVFRKLSVEQNILSMLELLGMPRKARKVRCDELLEQFDITHIRRSKAGKLSGGERRRLEIARCLVADPQIIMLDEPFAGIDPVTVQSIQKVIERLRETGISILITDHAAREILGAVDRCYVISKGVVLCEGTPEVIKQHPEVRRQYLGNLEPDPAAFSETRYTEPRDIPAGEIQARHMQPRQRTQRPASMPSPATDSSPRKIPAHGETGRNSKVVSPPKQRQSLLRRRSDV